MSDAILQQIRDLIQDDVNKRGLQTIPENNLITACRDDFAAACRSLAETPNPNIAIVTGFYIPNGEPPAAETDGPLGALFLARALAPLGIPVTLAAEDYCVPALRAGVEKCGLQDKVAVYELATKVDDYRGYMQHFFAAGKTPFTHLIAVERSGPAHTLATLQAQTGIDPSLSETFLQFMRVLPPAAQNRCYTMRGRDITEYTSPAHLFFEAANAWRVPIVTIGIGDGGNEIGMGKIPWPVIRDNIPNGGIVACRVPAHYLIVAGVSNWGAYGLAAGVRLLRGVHDHADLFSIPAEAQLLRRLVEDGPLVDGVIGKQQTTVDGLAFDKYGRVLLELGRILSSG